MSVFNSHSSAILNADQTVNLYNGKRAGDEWLKAVVENAGATVLCPKIPEQFKDLKDWTRAGATSDDLRDAMVEAEQAAAVEAQEQADKLALLLNSICAFLSRYVVFQMPQQAQVLALWVVHCWVLGAFDYTPYLHVRSPEKQCGKSRLLDCLVLLVLKAPSVEVVLLLLLSVWAFCRFYYFAFYVIEHYVDPSYRFSGLWSFARYLLSRHHDRHSA